MLLSHVTSPCLSLKTKFTFVESACKVMFWCVHNSGYSLQFQFASGECSSIHQHRFGQSCGQIGSLNLSMDSGVKEHVKCFRWNPNLGHSITQILLSSRKLTVIRYLYAWLYSYCPRLTLVSSGNSNTRRK